MTRLRVDALHKKWMKDRNYRREYEALGEMFSLAAALIEARARAGMTQEQVARRMKTTQAVIARLEGGGSKPSTRTLERYAKATGSRLKITFEPERARQPSLTVVARKSLLSRARQQAVRAGTIANSPHYRFTPTLAITCRIAANTVSSTSSLSGPGIP